MKHRCGKVHKNFHVSAKWLAEKYIEEFQLDPTWKIKSIVETIKKDLKVKVTQMKAWRARDHALRAINGDESEQYGRLYEYKKEILRFRNNLSSEVFDLIYLYEFEMVNDDKLLFKINSLLNCNFSS